MTTPEGVRNAKVSLTANTSQYVAAMNGAAKHTEATANKIVASVGKITAAWLAAAEAVQAAQQAMNGGAFTGAVGAAAAAEKAAATQTRTVRNVGTIQENAQRRMENAVAAADRKHAAAAQQIMNAQLAGEVKVEQTRIRSAKGAAKITQASLAVEATKRDEAIKRAQTAAARMDVIQARELVNQSSKKIETVAARGDSRATRDAINEQKEQIKDLTAAQSRLAAQESAFHSAAQRRREAQIKLTQVQQEEVEKAAAAKAKADADAVRGAERAAAAQERADKASAAGAEKATAARTRAAAKATAAEAAALRAVERERAQHFYELGRQRQAWDDLGRSAGIAGGIIAAALAATAVAAIRWEAQFADVTRVVQDDLKKMVPAEAEKALAGLEEDLRAIARVTPTSLKEIGQAATLAGQLGIPLGAIAGFVQVATKMAATTNMGAELAATQMAKLISITGDAPATVQKLASTLVALGTSGASTESEIMKMSIRMAGAAEIAGFTTDQVMALASSLASVGIPSELGGSAMQRFIFDMYTATKTGGEQLTNFAKVAGMAAKDFQRAFADDPAQALLSVIQGLDAQADAGQNVIQTLRALGINEIRYQNVLSRGMASHEQLAANLRIASEAYKANIALTDAYNAKQDTTAAKLAVAKNRINDAAITIGNDLLPAIATIADAIADVIRGFSELPGWARTSTTVLAAVAATIGLITFAFARSAGNAIMLKRAVDQLTASTWALASANGAASAASGGMGVPGAGGKGKGKGKGGVGGVAGAAGGAAAGGLLSRGGLAKIGGVLTSAGRMIPKLGPIGIAASIGLIGFGVAMKQAGDAADKSNGQFEQVAIGLNELIHTGKMSADVVNLLGANMEKFDAAARSGDGSKFEDLDAALSAMIARGDLDEAGALFGRLSVRANQAGMSTEALVGVLPQYAEAQRIANERTAQQAAELEETTQALANYQTIIEEVSADLFGAARVDREIIDAQQALRDSVKSTAKSLDDIRSATSGAVTSQMDAARASVTYRSSLRDLREQILGVADATDRAKAISDKFAETIEASLSKSFDITGAVDDFQAKVAEIKQGLDEIADPTRDALIAKINLITGGKLDENDAELKRVVEAMRKQLADSMKDMPGILSLEGNDEQARKNRADVEALIRAQAEAYKLTADPKNPGKAFAARRRELADALRDIGYEQKAIAAALAKFDSLPRSMPSAAGGVDTRRPVLNKSADGDANRSDIMDLVEAQAKRISQNIRLGDSEAKVRREVGKAKAELADYLRSLGFNERQFRPLLDNLDASVGAYRSAASSSLDATKAYNDQAVALEKLAAAYAAKVGEFNKNGDKSAEQVMRFGEQQKAAFMAAAEATGVARSRLSNYGSMIDGVTGRLANLAASARNNPINVRVQIDHAALKRAYGDVSMFSQWAQANLSASLRAYPNVTPQYNVQQQGNRRTETILYASGGWVSGPGGPRDDRIPAMLSNKEFVVNAAEAAKWPRLLEAINSGQYRPGMDSPAVGAAQKFDPNVGGAVQFLDRLAGGGRVADMLPSRAPVNLAPPIINVTGGDTTALAAAISQLAGRPVQVVLDGRVIAESLGKHANARQRTR